MIRTTGKKRLLGGIAAMAVAAGLLAYFVWPRPESARRAVDIADYLDAFTYTADGTDYDAYSLENAALPDIASERKIENEVTVQEGESHTFTFNMTACLASLEFSCRVLSAHSGDGEYSLRINGEQPFREAAGFAVKRQWTAAAPQEDVRGNQYAVSLSEREGWLTTSAMDASGYHGEPLRFAFKDGENTLTVTAVKGDLSIRSLRLYRYEAPKSYTETRTEHPQEAGQGEALLVEGEFPFLRTDASIAEVCDRTTPATYPPFTGIQKWNALGGSGWSRVGQNVTWQLEVEASGWYRLAIRFRQNFAGGMVTSRRLLIDGAVPFAQAEALEFPYGGDWQVTQPTDENGEPYLFYLEAGRHTLTLEVTLGELAQALNVTQKSLYELNAIYRKILMLTGSTPDQYRDYQVEKKLPDVLAVMKNQRDILQALSDWLYARSCSKGEDTAAVDKIVWQLEEFLKVPESIPASLATFQSNITSLSSWLQSRTEQPLTIDCIELLPDDAVPRAPDVSFFQGLASSVSQFFRSFTADYGMIGNVYDDKEALEVWIAQGRDQYQIIKEHIDNRFIQQSGTRVNLKLVSGGILEAIVAGIAPDVYLFCGAGDPVNFASRGALKDLSDFPDFKDTAARFAPQALVPYQYNGGTYALPLTQSFLMLFTRDDLLAEIG